MCTPSTQTGAENIYDVSLTNYWGRYVKVLDKILDCGYDCARESLINNGIKILNNTIAV